MLLALDYLAFSATWGVVTPPAGLTGPELYSQELQSLSPSAKMDFYVFDLTALGDTVYYFHNGVNQISTPVVWQGVTYQAWPVQGNGFDYNATAQMPRPALRIGNVTGLVSALCLLLNDCVGAKVTRKRTMAKFVDAVNFLGGVNASADPNAHYPDEIYYIDRKATEHEEMVEFELTAAFDVTGVKLPRRQIIQNICPWKYRGAECGYTGTNYFNADDTAAPNLQSDVCGKRLGSCKKRFGETSELPFGGFPGAGTVQ